MPNEPSIANDFGGVPMKALIGAPLKAAADANGMLARSQTQFLLSTCFEKDDGSGKLKPKMLEFDVERQVIKANGEVSDTPLSMKISVPLLTLIPLNSLAVEKLDVSFEMEVKSSTEYMHENEELRRDEMKGGVTNPYQSDKFSCEIHGALSNSRSSSNKDNHSGKSSSSGRYDITLHAGQLPLPTGITTIIDMLAKSIAPIQQKD